MLQRSGGTSRMALWPSTSSRQNESGSFAPPGKRQPTPTIATGGVSRGPAITGVNVVLPPVPEDVKRPPQKSQRTSTYAVDVSRRRPKNEGVSPRKKSAPAVTFSRSVIV